MDGLDKNVGTYADLRWEANANDPRYAKAKSYFKFIRPMDKKLRADGYTHRFNAFVSLLRAAANDRDWIFYSDFNNASHNINKWPINYRAVSEVRDWLLERRWIVVKSARGKNRSARYFVPENSKLRHLEKLQVKKLPWMPPLVSVRRGRTDLDRAPLDAEVMSAAKNRAWIRKYLIPPMEDLNDKLSEHAFTLFPYGKPDEEVYPEYCRIYTNLSRSKKEMQPTHGRIYPRNFQFPSKNDGFRQKTLIDGQHTTEVDVHASSLTLLSNDNNHGFQLPDSSDYYQHGPLAQYDRDLIKVLVQSAINGVSLTQSKWPKSILDEPKLRNAVSKSDWQEVSSALLQVYPVLKGLHKETGMDLMLVESGIILKAMNFLLDKGIGCLSIHDCLIVPKSYVGEAQDAFNEAYKSKGYSAPLLGIEGL